MALTDSLISFWKLDEASGNALDSHSTNDLTETGGTIGSAAGKVGNARDFEADDTEYFTHTDNAELSTGDIDYSVACWVKAETLDTSAAIIAKGASGGGSEEYYLSYNTGTGQFRVLIFNGAGTLRANLEASTFGTVSTGVWYYIVFWHDSVSNQAGISVNNVTDTTSTSGAAGEGAGDLFLGCSNTLSQNWDGLIDDVGFWKKVLSSTERSNLYNGGSGLAYPFQSFLLTDSLIEHYSLDEASGNATGDFASKTLTDGNTVGAGTGKISGARDFEASVTEYLTRNDTDFCRSSGDITVQAWINPESLGGDAAYGSGIASHMSPDAQGDWWLSLTSGGAIRFAFFAVAGSNATGNRVTADSLITTGSWFHVIARKQGTSYTVWINGTYRSLSESATSSGWTDLDFSIGRVYTTQQYHFDGLIDEVAVWSRALTNSEIQDLYNSGNGLNYSLWSPAKQAFTKRFGGVLHAVTPYRHAGFRGW